MARRRHRAGAGPRSLLARGSADPKAASLTVGAATVYFFLNTGLTAIVLSRGTDCAHLEHELLSARAISCRMAPRPPRGPSTTLLAAPFPRRCISNGTHKVYMGRIETSSATQQTSDLHLATIKALRVQLTQRTDDPVTSDAFRYARPAFCRSASAPRRFRA